MRFKPESFGAVLVFGALLIGVLTGCGEKNSNHTLTREEIAETQQTARDLVRAPAYSLVEFKDGQIQLLCAATYTDESQQMVRAMFWDPIPVEDNTAECQRFALYARSEAAVGGYQMRPADVLKIRRIGERDPGNKVYHELAARAVLEYWSGKPQPARPIADREL